MWKERHRLFSDIGKLIFGECRRIYDVFAYFSEELQNSNLFHNENINGHRKNVLYIEKTWIEREVVDDEFDLLEPKFFQVFEESEWSADSSVLVEKFPKMREFGNQMDGLRKG